MAEVKWIKLTTDMFDNRKIKYLRRLPDGNSIVLIWVMLLTMAGRCNASGMIFLTENVPYTPKMLANELDFEENTVILALRALEEMNMVVTNGSYFSIAGWEEYQNIEGMDKIRESKRLAQARWRAKQKELPECSTVDSTVDSTRYLVDDAEEDKEEEKDIDIENKKESVTCKQVVALYHDICISFPKIRSVSSARQKAIKARLKTYSLDDFRTVFENAEASAFLKGSNDRNWTATFDWLIKDSNMAKVLEGNYADKGRSGGRKEKVPGWFGHTMGDAEKSAIAQLMNDDSSVTDADMDQLARELQAFGRKGGV